MSNILTAFDPVRSLVVLVGALTLGSAVMVLSRTLAKPYESVSSWSAKTTGTTVAVMVIAFVLASVRYQSLITLTFMMVFIAALTVLGLLDARLKILPNKVTIPLLIAGLILGTTGYTVSWIDAFLGATAGFLSLYLPALAYSKLTGRRGVGFGDFKLMAAAGAWLGWQPLLHIIFLAGMSVAIYGAIYLRVKRLPRTHTIPFGPFLAFACILFSAV